MIKVMILKKSKKFKRKDLKVKKRSIELIKLSIQIKNGDKLILK